MLACWLNRELVNNPMRENYGAEPLDYDCFSWDSFCLTICIEITIGIIIEACTPTIGGDDSCSPL